MSGFQIMGTKHLGVAEQAFVEEAFGTLDTVSLVWPHDTPLWHQLVREFGMPSGYDYQAYLKPWADV